MVRVGLFFVLHVRELMASLGTGRQRTCLSMVIRLTMGCSRATIGLSLRMSSFLERWGLRHLGVYEGFRERVGVRA